MGAGHWPRGKFADRNGDASLLNFDRRNAELRKKKRKARKYMWIKISLIWLSSWSWSDADFYFSRSLIWNVKECPCHVSYVYTTSWEILLCVGANFFLYCGTFLAVLPCFSWEVVRVCSSCYSCRHYFFVTRRTTPICKIFSFSMLGTFMTEWKILLTEFCWAEYWRSR